MAEEDNSPMCRICYGCGSEGKDQLISPCKCKGTTAHVHRGCLTAWVKTSGRMASLRFFSHLYLL
jgi:E3 ubiquitin-protein ligase DOA10